MPNCNHETLTQELSCTYYTCTESEYEECNGTHRRHRYIVILVGLLSVDTDVIFILVGVLYDDFPFSLENQ